MNARVVLALSQARDVLCSGYLAHVEGSWRIVLLADETEVRQVLAEIERIIRTESGNQEQGNDDQ